MTITPLDPPLRFHVSSMSGHPEHLVDLGEYEGHGFCDCKHYACKLHPGIRDEGKRGDVWRCKHIRAARAFLAELVVQKFLEDEQVRKRVKISFP